ncbi:MAG: hypothetical protein A2X12_01125 [Bacteroidetes bacterium GWE2_29_8]|nr:MAG: hypothetical protein A2X12_01125 [Bacteroidetes bacterium GWE2_29_8]OFY14413.1 MAG: hypothetical protein A2X02_01260 [Bacteroidetes bacterium GWF2_29_10]
MKLNFFNYNNTKTDFISLNTKNCKACWKCISNCPEKIITKIVFFNHRHISLKDPNKCIGCFTCIKVCKFETIIKII